MMLSENYKTTCVKTFEKVLILNEEELCSTEELRSLSKF